VKSESVKYTAGSLVCQGRLIYDETATRQPLLLMAPNWRGITPENIATGEMLSRQGYVVFVVDMFGEGKGPKGTEQATAFLAPFIEDVEGTRKRISGGLDALTKEAAQRGIGDIRRRAAVGYCYGGSNVLDLARIGADVAAVVSIHGVLATTRPAGPGDIKAKVLVLHGAADPVSPKSHRDMFEAEMDAAGARWMLLSFGAVAHAYTDPHANSLPVAKYDDTASRYSYIFLDSFITDALNGRL
jgi:dienelactone hydrolase